MADYTTIAAVRSCLPDGVKIDDVEAEILTELIGKVTNRVNVALSIGNVDLPVTDPDLLGDLDLLTRREVVYQRNAAHGVEVENANPMVNGKFTLWVGWHSEFEAALALMRDGEYTGLVGSDGGPESYTMNAEEDETDPSIDPHFSRAQKF